MSDLERNNHVFTIRLENAIADEESTEQRFSPMSKAQMEIDAEERERRLRQALSAGRIGIWEWDIERNRVYWSDYPGATSNMPSSFRGTIESFYSLVHPEDRARIKRILSKAIDESSWDLEYRIRDAKGEVYWIGSKGEVERDAKGRAVRLIGINQEITGRKAVEADRERLLEQERMAREAAEAANRSKDEFLALISHELRSPLNAILGYTRLVRGLVPEASGLEQTLDIIERNGKTELQLIEDLLESACLISGRLRLEIEPVDLSVIIERAIEVARPAAEAKSIGISFDPRAAAAAGGITGDPARLQQVVWHLLSNAIKYTQPGGSIEITLTRRNRQARLEVADNGEGIALEYLPYVFDRFSQFDTSSRRRHGGLGLGLALVKHLVELHGGTVAAESRGRSKGARFIINLPVRAQCRAPAVAEESKSKLEVEASLLAGARILVIAADEDVRRSISATLGDYKARVMTAASGKDMLGIFGSGGDGWACDLLICDLGDEGGYQVIRELRAHIGDSARSLPAVALTADGRPVDRLRALQAGFQMQVAKPIDPVELITVVEALLKQTILAQAHLERTGA